MKAEMALGGGEGVGRRSDWLPLTRVHPSQNQAWEKALPTGAAGVFRNAQSGAAPGSPRPTPGSSARWPASWACPQPRSKRRRPPWIFPVFLVLCKMEGPQRLDLELCPYLPRVSVTKTSASDYMALMPGGGR